MNTETTLASVTKEPGVVVEDAMNSQVLLLQLKHDISIVLRKAQQCAALAAVVRERLGGATISSDESELFALQSELAKFVYEVILSWPPGSPDNEAAFGASGKLYAALEALSDANQQVAGERDDEQRRELVTRIGWLQISAADLAQELIALIEDLGARVNAMQGVEKAA